MFKWWQLHPMIAPLPRGFADEDTSHKRAKDWMNRATDHIEALEAALDMYRQSLAFDATMEGPKYKGANGSALLRAWKYDQATLGEKKNE